MVTILVTGSDTGVGKTVAVGALARILSGSGARVQIVKVIETGQPAEPDAVQAARLAGAPALIEPVTLESLPEPLTPVSAAAATGRTINFTRLVEMVTSLGPVDWRLIEGAGGIATQVDEAGRDWADFATAVQADAVVIVVPDRLGAINQARLAHARAVHAGLRAGVWLNETVPVGAAVAKSNRDGLKLARVPVWAEQNHGATLPRNPLALTLILEQPIPAGGMDLAPNQPGDLESRCQDFLELRERKDLRRTLRGSIPGEDDLNLANNDYLGLAHDPAIAAAVSAAAFRYGTSASASPLVTGWGELHEKLLKELCGWHGFPCGLIWSSGYAANQAILGVLPGRGDLVLADRLIHASLIAGIVRSGARLRRYDHLRLDHLETLLETEAPECRQTFVVTESLFSMDGDAPCLAILARLKAQFGFCLVLDEVHALGWYGPEGSGLARSAGVEGMVDILIGTFGKALGSSGAYSLFRSSTIRDFLVNTAGEFIYSTALAPTNVAAALAAIERVRILSPGQAAWHETSRGFRLRLRAENWSVPEGDSPIVPLRLDDAGAALSLASWLKERGIFVAAIRPPTVPAGTSRLRISLKRGFQPDHAERVFAALVSWRSSR